MAWDWFLQFFVEKGVQPTKMDVARWLQQANGVHQRPAFDISLIPALAG
jgi:hypothetical protein